MNPSQRHINKDQQSAIVIGAGIAGIAAALRLACMGYSVTVFEKNAEPGGKIGLFKKDGYSFDSGPSLFTRPGYIESLFELAGEPIEDYFSYRKLPVSCNYFFENGKALQASTNLALLAADIASEFAEDKQAVLNYLQDASKAFAAIGDLFIHHSLHDRSTFSLPNIIKAATALKAPYLLSTLHDYNASQFRSIEAVQLFDRFATYNGSDPYKAPAMLSMIPYLEMGEGTFYPKGGMISIAKALYQLAVKKRVAFRFNSPVEKIIHLNGKVVGITTGNTAANAKVIVSDSDVYFTYKNLLDDGEKASALLKQERSSSAIIFYWGINKTIKRLGLHNIFFSDNYRKEFEHLFSGTEPYNDPTVYVNITSKEEAEHSPAGCENWFVMVNAPANKGQYTAALIERVKKNVLQKLERMLGLPISGNIAIEIIQTPADIQLNTASYMGSLYGTSSNSKFAAFSRHPNASRTIKGLYFVGGSVHPGGGIPLCLSSAKIVADLVRKGK